MSYIPLSTEKINNIAEEFFLNKINKNHIQRQEKPILTLIAAQPGAGKTKIADHIKQELKQKGGYIHVDADRMREEIPNYAKYPSHVTQADAGKLVNTLRNLAKEARVNIIEEGTFRDSKSLSAFLEKNKQLGYHVEMVALAVPREQSLLGIYSRFEKQKEAGVNARFVPPDYHDNAFNGFRETVKSLENKFDSFRVFNREGQLLYDAKNKGENLTASDVLEKNLISTAEEKIFVLKQMQILKEKAQVREGNTPYIEEFERVIQKEREKRKTTYSFRKKYKSLI
ncbi:toxin [Pelistega indica]|uniref:Toxin n=1 Tax=Pelistega indica TaxID=1414851 RepID=V8G8E4_9BURK|nr:zeta toxin family protein [Pelistega indica]ETD72680.1 toxin [Pelistega indica]